VFILVKRQSPLEIYKILPKGIDFKKYKFESGMAFATELLERRTSIDDIAEFKDPKNREAVEKLRKLTTPPQRPVVFGIGDRECTIGGEEVMYRHELTFFNQTAIAVEIHDAMDDDALAAAVDTITKFKIDRIGEELVLDAIAVRCVSGDPATFKACAEKVAAKTDLPIILCSFDAKVLDAAARAIAAKRPLLYAATKDNFKEVGKLAGELSLPVVAFSTDLDELVSISKSLFKAGLVDICLDPGLLNGEGLVAQSINKFIMLRTAALENGDPIAGFPIIGVPATVWIGKDPAELDEDSLHQVQYNEATFAGMLLSMDASLLICHTGRLPEEVWFLLGFVTLRQNLFVDPRIYPSVDAGLIAVGNPNKNSPILVTTNYRMTKVPVEEDLKSAKVDCWLLVVDTGGIGVESSTAGGQFNADNVAEHLKKYKFDEKVDHRVIIIPGMAARIQGQLEDAADVKVMVGPNDSSGIPKYLEKVWNVEELMAEYNSRKG
jgi:acetyl-CoA decarbonylase/synthase complex subunit gamma